MKIKSVQLNGRRKAFEIKTRNAEYSFPYAKLRLQPASEDPIEEVFHVKLLDRLKMFLMLGGMPAVVDAYRKGKDITALR